MKRLPGQAVPGCKAKLNAGLSAACPRKILTPPMSTMRSAFIRQPAGRRCATVLLTIFLSATAAMSFSFAPDKLAWTKLPPLPDKHGFAGAFAGVSHGALIVAGGANFPETPVWEGGRKHWYDKIFVLEKPDGAWQSGGALPGPMGYGVSMTLDKGVLCIGGADAERHYNDVFLPEWTGGKIKRTALPPLPQPCAYASGAKLGSVVYIGGGGFVIPSGKIRPGVRSPAVWFVQLLTKNQATIQDE